MTSHSWEDAVLREIEDRADDLTPWESEFVESIRRQLECGRHLSEKQIDVLSDIHDKRVR